MNKIFKNNARAITCYVAICFCISALIVAESFILQTIVSTAELGHKSRFDFLIIFVIAYIFLQGLGFYYQGLSMQKLIKRISCDLRQHIFCHILFTNNFNKSAIERSAETVALTTHIETIQNQYLYSIFWGAVLFIQLSLAIVACLLIKPYFVFIILFLCIPSLLVPLLAKAKIIDSKKRVLACQQNFLDSTLDLAKGATSIALAQRQQAMLARFESVSQCYLQTEYDNAKVNARFDMLNKMATTLLALGVWLVGGYLIMNQQLTLPEIVAFSQLVMLIAFSLHMFLDLVNEFLNGRETLNSIKNKIAPLPVAQNSSSKDLFTSLKFINVSYCPKQVSVLNNVSLNLNFSKRYLLKGKSGSGKSSLINLIFNRELTFQGNILLDDMPIENISQRALLNNIGY